MIQVNQPEPPVESSGGGAVQVRVTRRLLVVVVLFLLAPWGLLLAVIYGGRYYEKLGQRRPAPVEQPVSRRVLSSASGPWGQLEFTQIAVEPPGEFIRPEDAGTVPLNWYFPGQTREQLLRLFQAAGMTPEQIQAVNAATQKKAGVWQSKPSPEVVLGLPSPGRHLIYSLLARAPENIAQNSAFSFRPETLEERLATSGLAPESISLFRQLIYPHGKVLLFADLNVALPRLADRAEKVRFIKMISRKTTLLANVKVGPQTDLERLVNYWSSGGRAKDVRPLLESLARVPGGSQIDVAHLLPQFARRRLYTFPAPDTDPAAVHRDGFWTALNFFNATPDDTLADTRVALERIKNDYYTIMGELRMGDLVLLALPDGRVFHAAVFLADDVVFTKNGASINQPWILMKLEDLVTQYAAFAPEESPVRVLFARRKAE